MFSENIFWFSGGNTPLHRAATEGHTELVKLLLQRGARAEISDFE